MEATIRFNLEHIDQILEALLGYNGLGELKSFRVVHEGQAVNFDSIEVVTEIPPLKVRHVPEDKESGTIQEMIRRQYQQVLERSMSGLSAAAKQENPTEGGGV